MVIKSNEKGANFELQIEALLRYLEGRFPDLVHVERHPSIVLQNQEVVAPDFKLTIELPYERSHYFIECQNRKRSSKAILHKIQHIRGKQSVKSFIFVYPAVISGELRRAFKSEGVICLTLDEFDGFIDRLSDTIRVQPPLPSPDNRPDHAMLTRTHDPLEELKRVACHICERTPEDLNRERADKKVVHFYLLTAEDGEERITVCEDCYRSLKDRLDGT